MNNYCVITTINPPTKAIEAWYEKFGERLIVVIDEKTPKWKYRDSIVTGLAEWPYAPLNHYARKNMGYLIAIKNKPDSILDVDDDTFPNSEWGIKFKETKASKSLGEGWFNAYEPMTTNHIWPRGFPFSKVIQGKYIFGSKEPVISSIQQGLVDGDPDVDAIYRLVLNKRNEFKFDRSIYLQPNTWCPFNSQATWFFPDAYPLLYLPVTVNFRMCDIWRSFIAQRCLWAMDQGVTFHSPAEFIQERNPHNLMSDFEDEIPGYLYNERIAEILGDMELKKGKENVCDNLLHCYKQLCVSEIINIAELDSVRAWIKDYENVTRNL